MWPLFQTSVCLSGSILWIDLYAQERIAKNMVTPLVRLQIFASNIHKSQKVDFYILSLSKWLAFFDHFSFDAFYYIFNIKCKLIDIAGLHFFPFNRLDTGKMDYVDNIAAR